MTPEARSSVLINYAVALLVGGGDSDAARILERADTTGGGTGPVSRDLRAAINYNRGLLSLQGTEANLREALASFRTYLTQSSPTSVWWRKAYRLHAEAAAELGGSVPTEQEFRQRNHIAEVPHLAVSVMTELGTVTLNQPTAAAMHALRTVAIDTLIRGTNVLRLRSESDGLEVVANERVLSIVIKSPEIEIPVSPTSSVRVGLNKSEFRKALGEYADHYEPTTLFEPGATYYYFRDLGLAARLDDNVVTELVIVQAPHEAI